MHCELDRKQKQAPVWYLTFGFHIRPYPQQKSFHSRPQTQAVGSWVKKTTASEEVAVKLDALLSSKRVYSTECCLNCRRCLNFEEPLLISFYSSEHLRTTISSSIVHSIFFYFFLYVSFEKVCMVYLWYGVPQSFALDPLLFRLLCPATCSYRLQTEPGLSLLNTLMHSPHILPFCHDSAVQKWRTGTR